LQDKEGRTPLHIALEADDTESEDTAAGDTESDDTAAYATKAVKLLLEHGANPDMYDNGHCTPLLIASKHGHMDIIKLLLKYNCNPYIFNNDNESSCMVAYQWGHEDIGDLLVNIDYHYIQSDFWV
jgi:ankyrin repeat protein